MIIDGLVVARPSRELFEDMRKGGLTACAFTCSIWENLEHSFRNIADWKVRFAENSDLVVQARSVKEIREAAGSGRTAIVLSWQNSGGFGDDLANVALFHDLGIKIVQLTYNTANTVGSGCWESADGGLTDFGRDVVWQMNELGMLVDLSHVGAKTTQDVIEHARRPPVYTHCIPRAIHTQPRNKTDEQLRAMADCGGFIGAAAVPHFFPRGIDTDVDDFADAIVYMRNLVGEDNVGLGSDLVQGQPMEFFDWVGRDKGRGRLVTKMEHFPVIKGFEKACDYGNIARALEKKVPSSQVEKIMGGNWLRFLGEAWQPRLA